MEQNKLKYNRDYSGSLYSIGYTDGYQRGDRNPRYRANDEGADLEVNATLDDEIAEYNRGYNDGTFHFNVDSKY